MKKKCSCQTNKYTYVKTVWCTSQFVNKQKGKCQYSQLCD